MRFLSKEELEKIDYELIKEKRLKNDELECAACGFVGKSIEFYNSSVHHNFKICPICGTVRFVCDKNRGYVKKNRH